MQNVFNEAPEESAATAPSPGGKKSSFVPTFVLLPILLLALLALIVYLFGWISLDRRDALDLVDEIRASSGERKALVAFELSRLESYDLAPAQRGRFLAAVERILQDSKDGDPRVRRSLALTLGRLADRAAVPALLEAADDADPETQIYALWALGAIRDVSARSVLEAHLQHEDPGIRKTAAFALGQLGDVRAAPSLRVALQDAVPDVTWNAAVALARLGDDACVPTLLPLLTGDFPDGALTPAQREELRINVIRSVRTLPREALRSELGRIASSDPSSRIRSEAKRVLEGRSAPPFGPAPDLASPR
jgi:HEAT repeat protein